MLSNQVSQHQPTRSKAKPRAMLMIGEEKRSALQLQQVLESLPEFATETAYVSDPSQALRTLTERSFDTLFLINPQSDQADAEMLQRIRSEGHILPIIALVDQVDDEIATRLTQFGADDCIAGPGLSADRLAQSVRYAEALCRERRANREVCRQAEMIQTLIEKQAQLSTASRYDALTHVFTRMAWEESIGLEHRRSVRHSHEYSVILVDIDCLNDFNEKVGHQAGNDCLVKVAEALFDAVRDIDIIARYDGGQFIVLCAETPLAEALILAERLRTVAFELKLSPSRGRADQGVTVSVGVACGPRDGWEPVVREAAQAMQAAKQGGCNRVCPQPSDTIVAHH